jgi:hypothetical protein
MIVFLAVHYLDREEEVFGNKQEVYFCKITITVSFFFCVLFGFVVDDPSVSTFDLDNGVVVVVEICRGCCVLVLEMLITASQSDSRSVFISLSNGPAAASISAVEPIKKTFHEIISFIL